jgi:hypothetical protein
MMFIPQIHTVYRYGLIPALKVNIGVYIAVGKDDTA